MLPLKMMIKYFIFVFLLNLQYPILILEIQHILICSSSISSTQKSHMVSGCCFRQHMPKLL